MTALDSRTQSALAPPAAPAGTRDPEVRLQTLFDAGTLRLLTPHDTSGALAATGDIDGMRTVAFASDPRVQGGAMGSAGCAAIVAAYDEAIVQSAPVIGLWHSGGARLREGVESLHAVGTVFAAMTLASGVVPQISVVLGAAAGGARIRAGPHRRGDPVRSWPHLRHGAGCGPQRDRRGHGHGAARRP